MHLLEKAYVKPGDILQVRRNSQYEYGNTARVLQVWSGIESDGFHLDRDHGASPWFAIAGDNGCEHELVSHRNFVEVM